MELVEFELLESAPTDVGPQLEFADVPSADPRAVVDPVWLSHRSGSGLPENYLPPAMPGPRPPGPVPRIVAGLLVGTFLLATAAGVCLTYGPPNLRH